MARPLYQIANDIRSTWPTMYFAAKPYVNAMAELSRVEDYYYHDSGTEIVMRFLANAGGWRGDDARRIKAELKEVLKNG